MDEYAFGNRFVSQAGLRSSIADYEAGTLTVIDRENGTYSVTKFSLIAEASPQMKASVSPAAALRQRGWQVEKEEAVTHEGRAATRVDLRAGREEMSGMGASVSSSSLTVVVDSTLSLSRDAFDVLVGAAFPNVSSPEHDALRLASSCSRAAVRLDGSSNTDFSLPLEQITRYEISGERIELRNRVLRVSSELPPATALAVPPGARLIEPDFLRVRQTLEELDRLPAPSNRPR